MSAKRERLANLIKCKCPRCYKGHMFVHPNPYNFSKIGQMPEQCEECELVFEPEPGFYFGSFFISYAIGAPWGLLFFCFNNFILGLSLSTSLMIVLIGHLLLTPYLMYISRAIYLYFHENHDYENYPISPR